MEGGEQEGTDAEAEHTCEGVHASGGDGREHGRVDSQ